MWNRWQTPGKIPVWRQFKSVPRANSFARGKRKSCAPGPVLCVLRANSTYPFSTILCEERHPLLDVLRQEGGGDSFGRSVGGKTRREILYQTVPARVTSSSHSTAKTGLWISNSCDSKSESEEGFGGFLVVVHLDPDNSQSNPANDALRTATRSDQYRVCRRWHSTSRQGGKAIVSSRQGSEVSIRVTARPRCPNPRPTVSERVVECNIKGTCQRAKILFSGIRQLFEVLEILRTT